MAYTRKKIEQKDTNFNIKQQLKPSEVYYAALGILSQSPYQLECVIFDKDSPMERARVYSKDQKHLVLYYPGKDNEDTQTATAMPLKQIIQEVDPILKEKKIENPLKIFIVSENNIHLLKRVQHYIKAEVMEGKLTTEDSMNRFVSYSEEEIYSIIPHDKDKKVERIQRGWQKVMLDDWQCGHYVLAAIARTVKDEKAPPTLEIKVDTVDKHFEFYQEGLLSLEKAKKMQSEKKQNEIEIGEDKVDIEKAGFQLINQYMRSFLKEKSVDDERVKSVENALRNIWVITCGRVGGHKANIFDDSRQKVGDPTTLAIKKQQLKELTLLCREILSKRLEFIRLNNFNFFQPKINEENICAINSLESSMLEKLQVGDEDFDISDLSKQIKTKLSEYQFVKGKQEDDDEMDFPRSQSGTGSFG